MKETQSKDEQFSEGLGILNLEPSCNQTIFLNDSLRMVDLTLNSNQPKNLSYFNQSCSNDLNKIYNKQDNNQRTIFNKLSEVPLPSVHQGRQFHLSSPLKNQRFHQQRAARGSFLSERMNELHKKNESSTNRQSLSIGYYLHQFTRQMKELSSSFMFKKLMQKQFELIGDVSSNFYFYKQNQNHPFSSSFSIKQSFDLVVAIGIKFINREQYIILPSSKLTLFHTLFDFIILLTLLVFIPLDVSFSNSFGIQFFFRLKDYYLIYFVAGIVFKVNQVHLLFISFQQWQNSLNSGIFQRRRFNQKENSYYLKIFKEAFCMVLCMTFIKIMNFFIQRIDWIIALIFVASQSRQIDFWQMVIVAKFNDLIKLFDNIVGLFEVRPKNQQYTIFLRIIIMILLLAHIIGCVFIVIGTLDSNSTSWLNQINKANNNDPLDNFDIYIASVYWSIETMITLGYGDIVPITTIERMYVICMAFVSCGVFAFSINTIGETIREQMKRKEDFRKKILNLSMFMKKRSIDRGLKELIFRHFHSMNKQAEENSLKSIDILQLLPESIKTPFVIELYLSLIKNTAFFSETFSHPFLLNLCQIIKEVHLCTGSTLDDTLSESVFFVLKGEIRVFLSNNHLNLKCSEIFKKGDNFNLTTFVTGQLNGQIQMKANSNTTLAYLKRSEFMILLDEFPLEKVKLTFLQNFLTIILSNQEKFFQCYEKVTLGQNIEILSNKCQCCDKLNHSTSSCQTCTFVPNKDKLFAECNKSSLQIRDKTFKRISQRSIYQEKYMLIDNQIIDSPNNYEQNDDLQDSVQYHHLEPLSNKSGLSYKNFTSSIIGQINSKSREHMISPQSLHKEFSKSSSSLRQLILRSQTAGIKNSETLQKFKKNSFKNRTVCSHEIIGQNINGEPMTNSQFYKTMKPTCIDIDLCEEQSNRDGRQEMQTQNPNAFDKYLGEEYLSNSLILKLNSQDNNYNRGLTLHKNNSNSNLEEAKYSSDLYGSSSCFNSLGVTGKAFIKKEEGKLDILQNFNSDLSINQQVKSPPNRSSLLNSVGMGCFSNKTMKTIICKYFEKKRSKKPQYEQLHSINYLPLIVILEDKCCEIDSKKDYQLYFIDGNCDNILRKINFFQEIKPNNEKKRNKYSTKGNTKSGGQIYSSIDLNKNTQAKIK